MKEFNETEGGEEYGMDIQDDQMDDDVKDAIDLFEQYKEENDKYIEEKKKIDEILEQATTISSPTGSQRMDCRLLFMATQRAMQKAKPLDFTLHSSGSTPDLKKVMRDSVSTVMDRGYYVECLRGRGGVFQEVFTYGDGAIFIGSDPESKFPIHFRVVEFDRIAVNRGARAIRSPYNGKSARKLGFTIKYSEDEFEALYPDFCEKVTYSNIPASNSERSESIKTLKGNREEEKTIEVAFTFDLDEKCYLVFAGGAATILEKKKGKEYPYVLDGKPYIPLIILSAFYDKNKFTNYGLGHLIYKLDIIGRKIKNMGLQDVFNRILPIDFLSVAQGKAAQAMADIEEAKKINERGQRAIIPIERSATDPNGSQVVMSQLQSQGIMAEWQAVWNDILDTIRMLGVNLQNEGSTGARTATESFQIEENDNMLIRQFGEWNATEYKFAVDLTIDAIRKLKTSDKTPLDLTTVVKYKEMNEVTLGNAAEEFKSARWFSRVDARSGNILSNAMQFVKYNSILPYLAQGSPEHSSAIKGVSQSLELDLTAPDAIEPGAMSGKGGGSAPEGPVQMEATATDRKDINPNAAVRGAAF